jgi:Mrp family chromosome partitioning ATPase
VKKILSGKGGVGKSSVTLQLALTLSLQGKSVGILDIDLTGPSIPRLIGREKAKITQSPRGWIPVTVHEESEAEITHIDNNQNNADDNQQNNEEERFVNASTLAIAAPDAVRIGLKKRGSLRCMSLGFLLHDRGDAVIWRGPKKTAMIRQFLTDVYWGDTDYLLVDTPPGTSDEHIALAEQLLTLATTSTTSTTTIRNVPRLAGAVLVTTPQAVATADVRKEINFCAKTNIPILGVIENMSGYTCPCCGEVSNVFSKGGGQVMATEMGVPFLGSVPVDIKFGAMVEREEIGGDEEGDEDDINGNEEGRGDDSQNGEIKNGEKESRNGHDDRLLVDRYQDTWSLPIFEGFAKTLLHIIEGKALNSR